MLRPRSAGVTGGGRGAIREASVVPVLRSGGGMNRDTETARMTVLVVDDDAHTREAYADYLEECGFAVVEAAHGGEAILHVYQHRPDVVLMDIAMPVLDGVETAESLRAHRAGLRILGITGCESDLRTERMGALCDGLLTKPCAPEVVVSRIRSLVELAA